MSWNNVYATIEKDSRTGKVSEHDRLIAAGGLFDRQELYFAVAWCRDNFKRPIANSWGEGYWIPSEWPDAKPWIDTAASYVESRAGRCLRYVTASREEYGNLKEIRVMRTDLRRVLEDIQELRA